MSVADISLMLSFLVLVTIVARMLKAIRLLDGRVTVMQEQLEQNRSAVQRAAAGRAVPARPASARTPIQGVPVMPAPASPRTPGPVRVDARATEDQISHGEATTHSVSEAEAEEVWARLAAEQARLKKAMGRDFQVQSGKRSAAEIRGMTKEDVLSAREKAQKLQRK